MIKNLTLLTGEDDFRLGERLRYYKSVFSKKYPEGNIEIFDTEKSLFDLENVCFTPNLFGGKRLIITESFWNSDHFEQAEKQNFFDRLPNYEQECTILAVEPKLDKRLKSTKFLREQASVEEFPSLDEQGTLRWIENYTQKKEGKISRANAQLLLSRCGPNLWNLSREIEKMLTAGENEISEKLIKELTLPHPDTVLWDFLESLSKKNVQGAMKRFHDLLHSGTTIHEIFPMIVREVRIHAQIRDGLDKNMSTSQITSQTKLHPYVVQKTLPLTKHFSRQKIEMMYDDLFSIDQKLKTGKISISTDDASEFELIIEKFILRVCQ